MNETHVTICGNVVSDPVRRVTKSGEPLITMRVAATPWRYDAAQREYVDDPTNFIDVTAFRALARGVAASVVKGDPVIVRGTLRMTPWSREGRSGTNVEIHANGIGHDLARGTSRFTRTSRAARPSERPSERPGSDADSSTAAPIAAARVDPGAAEADEYVVATG